MSEPGSIGPEKTVPAKKPISPARNIAGLVVLVAVLIVGVIEYSAYFGHRWAAAALKVRVEEEDKDLMTVQEAENLLGKAADGPAVDFKESGYDFSMKTYTWRGLLKQHTLTAYYTKESVPHLHHYETEGTKFELPVRSTTTPPAIAKKSGGSGTKEASGKTGGSPTGSAPQAKVPTDSKSQPSAPVNKPATPKSEPPGDPAPKEKSAPPSDKESTSKPAADSPAPKPSV